MNCQEAHKEISGYLDSEIGSGRAAELEGHLGQCLACRCEAGELQQVKGLIHSLPEVEPPDDLQGRLTAKMGVSGREQPVPCQQVASLLPAYLDAQLEQEQSRLVGDHLEQCSSCRKEEAALERTVELVHSLPEVAPPPVIRERVAELTRSRFPSGVRNWFGRTWPRVAVASAALASAAAVVFVLRSGPVAEPPAVPSVVAPQPSAIESPGLAPAPLVHKEQVGQTEISVSSELGPTTLQRLMAKLPAKSPVRSESTSPDLAEPVAIPTAKASKLKASKKEARFVEAMDILSAGGRDGYRIVEAGGYPLVDEEPPVYVARPTTPPAPPIRAAWPAEPAEDEKKLARPVQPAFSKLLDSNKDKPLPFAEVKKSLRRKQVDLDKIGPEHARQRPVKVPVIVVDIR